jgi:hypothetical protein
MAHEIVHAEHARDARTNARKPSPLVAGPFDTAPRRGVSCFPAAPVAVAALCEVAAGGLDELAAWIDANASDPKLRAQVPRLRAGAAELRSSTDAWDGPADAQEASAGPC